MTAIEAPTVDCPKCGAEAAFIFSDPRYVKPPWVVGYPVSPRGGELEWDCRRCGFTYLTPTADAPAPYTLPPSASPEQPRTVVVSTDPSFWDRLRDRIS